MEQQPLHPQDVSTKKAPVTLLSNGQIDIHNRDLLYKQAIKNLKLQQFIVLA